jgi:hypothetical protein
LWAGHEGAGAFLTQGGVAAALHDAKHLLALGAGLTAAFAGPADGAFHGELLFARRRIVRRTFVKDHGDVGAEHALDFHGFLRPDEQERAVQMRAEFHAVGLDLADFGEAEDLEPAAVRENGAFPVHELVQAAGGPDDVESRAEVEMIGVAEDDLGAHFAEFARVEGLDAGLGANGHEHGGVHDPMGGG